MIRIALSALSLKGQTVEKLNFDGMKSQKSNTRYVFRI